MTGAAGALVSTVTAWVSSALVLPAASVCEAVMVSAPSPKAVTSASTTAIVQAPSATTAVFPPANVVPLVKVRVTVAPVSPVPVMLKPARASASLIMLFVATSEMTGAAGAAVSIVIVLAFVITTSEGPSSSVVVTPVSDEKRIPLVGISAMIVALLVGVAEIVTVANNL